MSTNQPFSANKPAYTIDWVNVIGISFYHLVAMLAVFPYFFTWSGVALCIAGVFLFGVVGINIFYHRYLTHKGFQCPKWLEHCMAVLAVCSFQDTPAQWVAVHRRHHQFSDEDSDPHTPFRSFLWAHVGWILVNIPELSRYELFARYVKDVLRDPFYKKLEQQRYYLGIIATHVLLFFVAGMITGWLFEGTIEYALQIGLSFLVWGVFVRTVIVWHTTWSINSVTHIWGYQNYDTGENSRNNIIVGLLSAGEGWHNNHHADPRSARHGHLWWELDLSYWAIRVMGALKLVWKINEPRVKPMISKSSVSSENIRPGK